MSDYGFLSVVPPLLALVLAFKTKDVLLSLFSGVIVGVFILSHGNPYTALIIFWQDIIFKQLTDAWVAELLILMTLIGGFTALLEASGGVEALTSKFKSLAGSRAKVQVAAWLGGLALFFSDSANCLILGPIFRPIAERAHLSREKLAYIVDSTASPVCMLVPFTSWGILIGGFYATTMKTVGVEVDVFTSYVKSMAYQFYPLLAVLMVPLVAVTKKEFGPMIEFERRALADAVDIVSRGDGGSEENVNKRNSSASIALIPLAVIAVVLAGMFISFGFTFTAKNAMTSGQFRLSLASAYFLATLACMLLLMLKKIMSFKEAMDATLNGCKGMMPILIMLIAAFSLSAICGQMKTAVYLTNLTKSFMPKAMLPAVIFAVSLFVSFATGSANGTQGIIIPLAVPLALGYGLNPIIAMAAAAAGGLFGDHCSPISDTSILASSASGCDPVDHAKSQLPYALICALSAFIMFIIAGLELPVLSNPIVLTLLAIALTLALFFFFLNRFGEDPLESKAKQQA